MDPLNENWIIEYWGQHVMGVNPSGRVDLHPTWLLANRGTASTSSERWKDKRADSLVIRPGQRHSLDGAMIKARKLRDQHQMTVRLRNATTGEILLADIL